MSCSHAIECCGSEWFQSALTATISTTSARKVRNSLRTSLQVCLAILLVQNSSGTPQAFEPQMRMRSNASMSNIGLTGCESCFYIYLNGLYRLRKNSVSGQDALGIGDRKPSPWAFGSFLGHPDAIHFSHFLRIRAFPQPV